MALLVGFAVQALGTRASRSSTPWTVMQKLVFKILAGIMWLAPIGAFGAIAGVVGNTGWAAIGSWACCARSSTSPAPSSSSVILGACSAVATGISIFKLLHVPGPEYLLIVATSSSETALPRLIAKMEHARRSSPPSSASSSRPDTRSTSTAPPCT